jgi:hypothetical protein
VYEAYFEGGGVVGDGSVKVADLVVRKATVEERLQVRESVSICTFVLVQQVNRVVEGRLQVRRVLAHGHRGVAH